MTKLDTLDILGAVPLFSGLTREELEALAQARVVRKYPRNATIINDGDTTNAIYIINQGKVKVCKTSETKGELRIADQNTVEIRFVDDRELARLLRHDGGRTRLVVDQRHFAEMLAFVEHRYHHLCSGRQSEARP